MDQERSERHWLGLNLSNLVANERRAPGEAAAEGFEQQQLTALDLHGVS
jgi:hypothetical protein